MSLIDIPKEFTNDGKTSCTITTVLVIQCSMGMYNSAH